MLIIHSFSYLYLLHCICCFINLYCMYFRGPHGRLALPNESPSLNKANLLTYLLTYIGSRCFSNNVYIIYFVRILGVNNKILISNSLILFLILIFELPVLIQQIFTIALQEHYAGQTVRI